MVLDILIADLVRYLQSRQWQQKPYAGKGMDLYEGPLDDDGFPIVLLVPQSEQMPGYDLRVSEILQAMSAVENRDVTSIVREIKQGKS